jgi:outer membrane protein OmpA-like peptidoglycan-associated protein
MKITLSATALAAVLAFTGCASAPDTPPPELTAARDAVRRAETDPSVLRNAPLELKRATDALNRANTLYVKRERNADVLSAAYIAQREADAAMTIAQAKRNEDATKQAQITRAETRADIKASEAERARADAAAAQLRADSASGAAATAAQQAADAQAQAQALAAQLAELQAKQTERGMLVTLGDVLFEFNRAEIKPTAQGELRKLADFLQKHPERNVLIEGYTDNIGSAGYNATLSQRRAEAVANALVGLGIAPQRLKSVGYGKDFPVAENNTDTNRALNRRVEVYISQGTEPVRGRG